jgi:cell fate (sporulation/competence/biofilm development) regulator YlbF (YheA/YmcA/DUF963 family)
MDKIHEMALELGQALGRTDEYKALHRAASAVEEDREMVELQNALQKLESDLMTKLRSGREPDADEKERYEGMARKLQTQPAYQRLVSAQSNFDKVLQKVNETISKGIEEGSKSRIILPS